jgi:hypothetical protein
MTSLVFVPCDRVEASALRAGGDFPARPACAPTADFAGTLEPTAVAEEVEFAALNQAGVLTLSTGADPLRLVLAADVADNQVADRGSEPGAITVSDLRWSQVRALFADEPAAAASVARARADLAAVGPTDTLAMEAVMTLQDEFDLLWFAPDELDRLPS